MASTDTQHVELVEKIQQLNLLRESNATLRADSEAHAKRSRELDAKLKGIVEELDPLRERARTIRAELDASNEHVARLEEENRRWQERNSQLLTKVRSCPLYKFYAYRLMGRSMTASTPRNSNRSRRRSKA